MEEDHGSPLRPDAGPAIAEDARALLCKLAARFLEIVDLVADMVQRAGRVVGKKTADRRLGAERFEQFDPGVLQRHKSHAHSMLDEGFWLAHGGSKELPISRHSP